MRRQGARGWGHGVTEYTKVCYITVDSETVASQNGVCMTQRNVSYNINGNDLVLQLPMIKEKSNKKCNLFCHVMNNIGFPMKGKLARSKSVL